MIDILLKILEIDSTSGKENVLADFITKNIYLEGSELEIQNISNDQKNLFFKWGSPEIIFCSHLDTVPPYIPPRIQDHIIHGRGSCDAKGQLACMYEVCSQLYKHSENNFGLLMLSGEEVGSYGAIRANQIIKGSKYVIIGEPTENKLIKASKGNLLYKVKIKGRSSHSGYPEYGDNAILRLQAFLNNLSEIFFQVDNSLGKTTYNIGRLESNNAYNVISDCVTLEVFFRTTFKTHKVIKEKLPELEDDNVTIEYIYGKTPMNFLTLDGFETDIVSYGTDATDLNNLGERLFYGPGSILDAHTDDEYININDMHKAVEDLKKIYFKIKE